MTEYSRMAKGSFTAASGQTSAIINLPFTPDYVEVWNLTNIGNAASAGNILRAYWDNNLPAFTPAGKSASRTMVEVYNATPAVIFDTIFTNGVTGGTTPVDGIDVFSAGQMLQYGPAKQIVASTGGASTTSFQVTAHGYAVGDTVLFEGLYQSSTTGMPQMAGIQFTIVTITDANNFVVKWAGNGSNYTNLSASPTGSTVKKVLYPFLYPPQDNVIAALTLGSTTTVTTTQHHNFEVGQAIAFRIPNSWGTVELNSLPNNLTPGAPAYGYVTSITDNWTFVCNINSSSYTAFNANQTVSGTVGRSFPQVLAVGDVNTGGQSISSTSVLYPPPQFPTSSSRVSTINGPAIKGAFVNNTRQGFVIGNGTPQQQAGTGTIVTSGSVILWHAYLHDYASP